MSTTTTNYGLIKPDITDPILIGQLNDNADTIDATMKSISDALDVAKLGIKYKGEVYYYSDLPSTGNQIGDAYTVKYSGTSGTTPDGTEYVWGTVSGTNQWINFSKDSYTKAEVDALLALKQNALSSTQLDAVNSGIDSTKVEQIKTNKNNILSLTANGGGMNKLKITATSSAEMTINDDKTVSITVNTSTQKQYNLTGWIPNNYVGMKISGMTVNSNDSTGYFISVQYSNNGSSWANETNIATIGSATILDYPYVNVGIVVRGGNNLNGVLFKPMISAEGESYQPYALSNAELTAALSPSAIQAVTPTIDNYVQIDGGGYVRIGNLVIVQIRATWLQSCSEGLAIIRGLPKPLLNYDVYTAGASVVNNFHKNMSVMGNGTIAWVDGVSPSSGGLVLSAVYICKD